MDQRQDEFIQRPLYVYDLPPEILTTIVPKIEATSSATEPFQTRGAAAKSISSRNEANIEGSKACSLCNTKFITVEDQRGHIKSDWHRYNLKQKLRNLPPVSEENFEKLLEDLDESLSGSNSSDSEEEDEDRENRRDTALSVLLNKQAAISRADTEILDSIVSPRTKLDSGKTPLLWFSTPILPSNISLGIYRAVFTHSELEDERRIVEVIRKKQLMPQPTQKPHLDIAKNRHLLGCDKGPHVFLCMIGGGHFAAMVVSLAPRLTNSSSTARVTREATVLAHKTFHRYTTRRKQGGAQSANDSAKGAAHSAGSNLRRYNEAALTSEVRLLLLEWKAMIDTSEILFVRAIGNTNRKTLFGPYEGQLLRQNDSRLRRFPFSTRRATQQELMRSFIELTRVKLQAINEAVVTNAAMTVEDTGKQSSRSQSPKEKHPSVSKQSEEANSAILYTAQLQTLIRRSKLPALLLYLKTNDLSSNFRFYPEDSQQNYHSPTPLHLAASLNSPALVSGLLLKAGASPLLLNGDGKLPYDLAGDRVTRDAFRVARSLLGESKWNWDAAHVSSPISKAEADERDAKERHEIIRKEDERRRVETERLKRESPKMVDPGPLGKAASIGRALALGQTQKTAQEKREEEVRGLTPEMRAKLERERRARAAEERIKKFQGGS